LVKYLQSQNSIIVEIGDARCRYRNKVCALAVIRVSFEEADIRRHAKRQE
jgi:hypothetical protein